MATVAQPETLPENPFVQDIEEELPPPTSLVIFGGTGDLAARKLLPAVYNLRRGGLLPEKFDVIGIGRREGDNERFRTHAHDSIAEFSRSGLDDDTWKTLEPNLEFLRGDLDDPKLFEELAERLARHEAQSGPRQRVFYLAVIGPQPVGNDVVPFQNRFKEAVPMDALHGMRGVPDQHLRLRSLRQGGRRPVLENGRD